MVILRNVPLEGGREILKKISEGVKKPPHKTTKNANLENPSIFETLFRIHLPLKRRNKITETLHHKEEE